MKYINDKQIRVGDIVHIKKHKGIIEVGVISKIIRPNTPDAKNWSAPNGGVLIEGGGLGLSLWTTFDEDLIFVRRKAK